MHLAPLLRGMIASERIDGFESYVNDSKREKNVYRMKPGRLSDGPPDAQTLKSTSSFSER